MSDVSIGVSIGVGGVFLVIRRPPRSTQSRSSAASDVYKRQHVGGVKESIVTTIGGIFISTV